MGARARLGTVLVAALFAAQAQAATRIALAMRGDRRSTLATQLATELCGTYECVLRSRVYTGARPDFDKARALGVKAILMGAVSAQRGQRTVSLALVTGAGRPALARRLSLTAAGTLTRASLDRLMDDLRARLGRAPPAPEPAGMAPQPEVSASLPPAPVRVATPATPPPPVEQPAPPVASAAPPPPAPPIATPPEHRQRLLAVEAGYQGTRRDLSYEGFGAGPNSLLAYQASLISSPRLRLELFPLAGSTDGLLAGLGLFADYGFSMGLQTQNGGTKQSSSFSRIQAGTAWRIYPSGSSQVALVPAVSYQRTRFTVDGGIAGLPNVVLTGVKGSLGAEIPIGSQLTVLLGGGYVRWLKAQDLVGDFFRDGSAYALEAEGGVSWAFSGSLSLRILGEYSVTKYSLSKPSSSTYSATGARDEYLGGRTMLRWQP